MSTDTGKVVVNRAMSLDGFVAGPGHTMDWIFDFLTPDAFPQVLGDHWCDALIGRSAYEVAKQMPDEERTYEERTEFVLATPPDKPDPNVTFLPVTSRGSRRHGAKRRGR